jgi:diguanylate cyclase (GGDEF)-like protein/PAS domain S-box-containing protein/putative nucleotidyltransferase with HDIG domain
VLALCIVLDGGLDSPLIFLLALPLLNAALALPTREVAICAIAAVLEFVIVAVTDPSVAHSADDLTALSAFGAGVVVLAIGWTINRSRLEEQQTALLNEVVCLATTDSLTGCLSHGALFEHLDVEISRALRNEEPLSLLMMDIDLFKSFNDTYGHAAGNEALAGLGSVLRSTSRNFDVAGRVGGDEFAVVLPATPLAAAHLRAERLIEALRQPNDLGITMSVGAATLDRHEPTRSRLFRDADAAMYQAKAHGRTRVVSSGQAFAIGTENAPWSAMLEDTRRADADRSEDRVRAADNAAAEALAIVSALESSTSVGLGFIDTDLRVIRLNEALAAVHGGRVEDQLGRTVAETVPGLWPALEPIYRKVLTTGEPLHNQEIVGQTAGDPGHPHYWLTSLFPVRAHGQITGVCPVAIDITHRKELEASQRALTRSVVSALASSVETRDPYTAGHQARVAEIAVAIATELGLDAVEIDAIDLGARIHDVGKLAIPTEILSRPGRLREAEMALVREHSQAGSDMLKRVDFPDHVREMILQHHERLDGSGYPNGVRGEQLLMGSRIIAVADVVEAMSSHRPYRPAVGIEPALKEIERGSGVEYDSGVVDACIRLFGDGRLSLDPAD